MKLLAPLILIILISDIHLIARVFSDQRDEKISEKVADSQLTNERCTQLVQRPSSVVKKDWAKSQMRIWGRKRSKNFPFLVNFDRVYTNPSNYGANNVNGQRYNHFGLAKIGSNDNFDFYITADDDVILSAVARMREGAKDARVMM
ncbi:hypothetical protein HELRODRAFT_160056 [Helobdella robusta]|uniref:Uncharacterized protein n=1 Tax=Helobdella robusta TaxID=6412 RepID=T1EPQ4_HELRO|nr:hypothetical protein HELRODRAFT_160056 [Helobdella robusta]ESO05957.1 hypothetical protein HELRODRAFT_160056 [Helobdella robusta]